MGLAQKGDAAQQHVMRESGYGLNTFAAVWFLVCFLGLLQIKVLFTVQKYVLMLLNILIQQAVVEFQNATEM